MRSRLFIGGLLLTGVILCSTVTAQEAAQRRRSGRNDDSVLFEKQPPDRRGQRRPNPERLRRKLEELRERDPSDPRIKRIERILERLESNADDAVPQDARRPAARRNRNRGTDREFDPKKARAFIALHPELEGILDADGRTRRRARRPLMRIMKAFDEGDDERGHLMIRSARLQMKIAATMGQYRRAKRNGDKVSTDAHLEKMRGWVREQVQIDHQIKGLELKRLEARLTEQKARHADNGKKVDAVAERRLKALLEGKGRRRGRSAREGGE